MYESLNALLFNDQDAPGDELSRLFSEIVLGRSLTDGIQAISPEIPDGYVGAYALTANKSRTTTVSKSKNDLIAKVSGQDI